MAVYQFSLYILLPLLQFPDPSGHTRLQQRASCSIAQRFYVYMQSKSSLDIARATTCLCRRTVPPSTMRANNFRSPNKASALQQCRTARCIDQIAISEPGVCTLLSALHRALVLHFCPANLDITGPIWPTFPLVPAHILQARRACVRMCCSVTGKTKVFGRVFIL